MTDVRAPAADLRPDSIVTRAETMALVEFDDCVVLMDTREGRYLELDAVGACIWALLDPGRSISDIRDALLEEYDVDGDTCLRDVLDFTVRLAELGAVVAHRPNEPPAD